MMIIIGLENVLGKIKRNGPKQNNLFEVIVNPHYSWVCEN